jgi:hypothetical protein
MNRGLTASAVPGAPATLPEPLRRDWLRLAAPTSDAAPFTPGLLDGLPGPARRWLTRAIAPGTPLRRAAVLRQHGAIKAGGWQRYEADWVLAPPVGFVWAATSHLGPIFIRGFDRLIRGTGEMRWRLLGRIPFLAGSGADIDRSTAGRLAGELCFVPAAALSGAVRWEGLDDRRAVMCVDIGGRVHRVTVTVAASGQLERVELPRWGDPDGNGFRDHIMIAVMGDGEGVFDGFTIPTSCRAGWWAPERGETKDFIRFTIDHATYR